ncbi:MAG: hypothetical protein EPO06_00980 [Burkholderiaceae bacterium]|nr:MAG: hypothetical protein EPO06_00980 [Burkholderiaceae bacterium]
MMLRLRFFIFACLLWGAVSSAQAAYYVYDDSAAAATSYPWIDISATGTTLALGDDAVSAALNLGFTFNFGGTNYTQVRVMSNGMLQFAGTATNYNNAQLPLDGSGGKPNIDFAMLPLWDDYNTNNTATYMRYRSQGTAPNRVFIVSWLAAPYYCFNTGGTGCNGSNQTTAATATFQVQIYEQGQFVYSYGTTNGAGGAHSGGPTFSNSGGTVGVEVGNTDYVQYSYNTASVPNGRTILWSHPSATTPGGFNAYETTTAAGAITGIIKTKIAGSSFNLDLIALNTAKTAILTTFTGAVKVELLNASDNSAALDANNCRSSWTTIQTLANPTFVAGDNGRKTVAFQENNAWQNVRVRISYPATGVATAIGCSTDNFAIRPSSFASVSINDADWQTAGTTRTLTNTAASGGNVHKAGRPLNLQATAVNALGVPTTTTNYTGTPTATLSACAGTACSATLGTLTLGAAAVAGVINTNTASYSEVGAFSMQLSDQTFANVDAADSTTAERYITSSTVNVGRFVPDHFDLTVLATPQLLTFGSATCGSRSFTYIGQPFGYATVPQMTITAKNFSGATTVTYQGALWKLIASNATQTYAPLSPTVPGLDVSLSGTPTVTAGSNGVGSFSANAADQLTYVRSVTAPQNSFNANITLTVDVSDNSESGVSGNGTIASSAALLFNGSGSGIAFDAGNTFRYGRLRLSNAFGSERLRLPVPGQLQTWNGTGFVNAGDSCTTLAASAVSLTFGGTGNNLAACETQVSMTAGAPATLQLSAPGVGNDGWVDLRINLSSSASGTTCTSATPAAATTANKTWLRGNWGGGNYDKDPTARARFGAYKGSDRFIFQRENY